MNLLPFLASGLGLGAVYALSGVGLVVLYRATGTLNFALGGLGALGAHCAWSIVQMNYPPSFAWGIAIGIATLGSYLYGRLVAPALSHRARSVRAIGTLGFALTLLGFMGLIWGETIPRRLTFPTDAAYVQLFSVRITQTRILAFLLAVALVPAVGFLLSRTRIGLAMRSLASDRELSSVIGINVTATDSIAWLVSGILVGIAGLLLADLVRLQPTFLTFLVIPAVAAALLGRLSSLSATLLAGLGIGVLESLSTAVRSIASYRSAVPFVVAVVFIAIAGGRRLEGSHEMTSIGPANSALDTAGTGPRCRNCSIVAMIVTMLFSTVLVVAFADSYWLSIFTSTYGTALVVAGASLLYGQLGLVSLCQFALAGVGGWVALRVHHGFHPPFEVSVFAAGIAASAIGVVWGLPALRMRGLHLALVTLMFAGAFQVAINVWGFPNGGTGLLGQIASGPRIMMNRPPLTTTDAAYLIYIAVLLLLGLFAVELHRYSKPGRSWALIQKDERMAAASGVRIVFYKSWAFALSGFLAGVGGAALAGAFGQLDSAAFGASESILLFALTVVGGTTSWLGTLLAAVLMRVVPALLNDIGLNGFAAMILFGAALIHALVSTRHGIAEQLFDLVKHLRVQKNHVVAR